jgi:signal transduction histidine kinase
MPDDSPEPIAPDTAIASQRRISLLIWLAAGALILLTWWQVLALVGQSRQRELNSAEQDLGNLTRLTQEHAIRTLRSADQAIRFVQSRYLEIGKRIDLQALTTSGVIDNDIFNQVGIIDAKGIYILSNLPTTKPMDLSDREHFKVHVASDKVGLFVSQPVLGRASGKWSIQMTRRITLPNGDFGGVVVVSIDPGYFSSFYSALKLGPNGLAALYGLDGISRVRRVGSKEGFGYNALAANMFTRISRGQLAGSYTEPSAVDGVTRLYYFRKVPQYDLVVSAGFEMQDLLANHHQARNALLLQATLMSLLVLALAGAIVRHLRRIQSEMAARQRVQLQVEDRTQQLSAIFTMSPDGFVSFDHERHVKYVSPAFANMTALGEERLEGLDEQDFSNWLARRCNAAAPFAGIAALRAKVMDGKPDTRELIQISRDGNRMLQVGLRCSESSTVSQILYFRDVTPEFEVDQMKSEFLATAAHELRTPMQSILGFSEVLLHHELDASARQELLAIIYQESGQMAKILDELLDLARIEARRGKDFRFTRVCLQDLAGDLVHAFLPPSGRNAPELQMNETPLYVMADAGKLRQALLNVLSNAYKYSPAGGPVVLQIESGDEAGHSPRAWIHITDQGIGLTQEQRERVCERFYRADTSGKIPGTGLGMRIVQEICEMHGGELVISSSLGVGTRVSLSIPC